MASFTAEVVVNNGIGKVIGKLKGAVSDKLYAFATDVMNDSDAVVPELTGALRSTGHVELPQQDGDIVTVELGYGGPSVDYALKVHEDLDAHVHWSRPGSGPKYLENPYKARQAQLEPAIAEAVNATFE